MKCSKCKKNYKDTEATCPKCGEVNHKMLEDKTIAIQEINEDLSLTGMINNQIEEFNEEEIKIEEKKKATKKKTTKKDKFGSKKDIKERKKILTITSFIMLGIILLFVGIVIVFKGNNDKYDYVYELNLILNDYDNIENNTEIYDILAYIGNDDEKIENVHNNTNMAIKGWISKYKEEDYYGLESIEKETNTLKDKIEYVYNIEYEDVKLLEYEDYEIYIKEINLYFNDSKVFYEALSYYNKNYYNESYAMFGNVPSDNLFKDKAEEYQSKIVDDILTLLNNDIDNMLKNINDNSSDADKLDIYLEIENVIATYNDIYTNLDLDNNEEYNKLMKEYKDKINEYVPLVVGEA